MSEQSQALLLQRARFVAVDYYRALARHNRRLAWLLETARVVTPPIRDYEVALFGVEHLLMGAVVDLSRGMGEDAYDALQKVDWDLIREMARACGVITGEVTDAAVPPGASRPIDSPAAKS